ncbi:MAG: hypothetical protein HZA16_15805 [Nitrospirae bacterium]|nr:hypothetical protein [Nitrospirota bacterium]
MINRFSISIGKDFTIKVQDPDLKKTARGMADSINDRKIQEIFPPLYEKVKLVFSDGRKRRVRDFRQTCITGANLYSRAELIPVKNEKGKVKEVFVVFDEVSMECHLNRKLSESEEKMIEIGKIASSLAHGVRNPLNAIKGAVVYLREKYGHEPTLLEFSTIMNVEIDKLDSFISDFLSAARGEMESAPVVLNDILKRITAMVRPRAEIQNIRITHDLSSLPHINADSFQIEQALFNIINNAVEAMPDGGVLLIRTSLKWEKDRDFAVIDISDSGKGIPREKLKRLGRLSGRSGKSDRGFGIFLSREIIKSHGGKLLWESVGGKGTAFRIYLPAGAQRQAGPG